MAFLRRQSKLRRAPVAPAELHQDIRAELSLAELAVLVRGTTDSRGRLTFKREGHKCSVLPQQHWLTFSIAISSAIALSLRDAGVYGDGFKQQAMVRDVPVCWRADGQFSPAEWLHEQAHVQALGAVTVHEGECLFIYRNGLTLKMRAVPGADLLTRIDAVLRVVSFLPPDVDDVRKFRSSAVPAELRPLRASALKWGISDDAERTEALNAATRRQLTLLVTKVEPWLQKINAFLDADDSSDEACMLGDLAQATLEARALLAQAQ